MQYFHSVIFIILFTIFVFPSLAQLSTEKVVPAVLGSSVTLDCTIPESQGLLWDHYVNFNQTVIALKGNIVLQNRGNMTKFFVKATGNSQSLIIQSLSLQDDGTYRCADLQNVNYKQAYKVNILVSPTRIELLPPPKGGLDEGTMATLKCEADGGKPPPVFEWYIEGPYMNRTKWPSAENDFFYPNGTGRRQSLLPIQVDRSLYKAKVSCITEITYFFVVQNNMSLNVNLFPGVPSFRNFDGIFNDGETKTITCESRGSLPAANITWFINDVPQLGADTRAYKDQDDTYYVTSSLKKRFDKTMDGQNFTCRAMNVVLQRQGRSPVEAKVVLRAAYMPVLHAINGSLDIYEHQPLNLECHVDARPMSTKNEVFWLKNGVIVLKDTRIKTNFTSSDGKFVMSIHEVNRFDIGQYQCQASNALGIARSSPPLYLNVLYRPVCLTSSIEKVAASIGQTVTLTCRVTANPTNVTVTWRYKTRQSIIKDNQPTFTDPGVDKTATSSIQLPIRLDRDYTDVECIASNSVGTIMQPCLYMIVKPGPPEIPRSCNMTLVDTDKLDIRCAAGFSGGGNQYFILQKIDGKSFVTINTNDVEPKFNVSDLIPATNYTYRVCSTSDSYEGTVSCANTLSMSTATGTGTSYNEPVAAASTQDTTLYIVGGCIGFVFLVLLTVIVAMCIIKRRQQSPDNIENIYMDVADHHGDPRTYHIGDKDIKHESMLPTKLEEEDHHHHHHHDSHHHSHHSGDRHGDSHHGNLEEMGPATHLKLNEVATQSRNTFERKESRFGNTFERRDLDRRDVKWEINEVDDIYAISTKHRNYKDHYESTASLDNKSPAPLSASRLTLTSSSSNGLCYSESDIQKALDMSSDSKELSVVTNSIQRSSSLGKIDNLQDHPCTFESTTREYEEHKSHQKSSPISILKHGSEGKSDIYDAITDSNASDHHETGSSPEQMREESNNRKESLDSPKKIEHHEDEDKDESDEFVYIFDDEEEINHTHDFQDKVFVNTQTTKYNNVEEENTDDDSKLKRRRSYHKAIKSDLRNSKNVKFKIEDKENVDENIQQSQKVDNNPNYDNPKALNASHQEKISKNYYKDEKDSVNNNFNKQEEPKHYRSKDLTETDLVPAANITAYF